MPTESFTASFADATRRAPASPALLWDSSTVSYRELDAIARWSAAGLVAAGVGPERPVCVIGTKSPELIGTLIACFRWGYRVLLPPSDLGERTLVALAEQAGCGHLVRIRPGHRPEVTALGGGAPGGPIGPAAGPALMLTTSGSTGLPKIVPLSRAGVDRFTDWAASSFDIGPGATVLNYAPLNFDLCLLDVWTSLARGACVALVGEDVATAGEKLLELAARCTVVQSVPMLFRLVTDAAGPDGVLAKVRHVITTGDVLPGDVFRAVRRVFAAASVYNLYGCTETNDSMLHRVEDSTTELDGPLPIGVPIEGVDVAVLVPDGSLLDGPGSGELIVRTPFQADGYLDPTLDAGRFVPAPDGLPPGRWYRTGDLVRRNAAGVHSLDGRADFHVKVRGVRVNTAEVELVLGEHDQVVEAAVVAVPDEVAGHRLHAVIRRSPGSSLNSLRLRQHCAARLARTAIPGRVLIVDDPLPRTSTGKVDRNLIRQSQGGN